MQRAAVKLRLCAMFELSCIEFSLVQFSLVWSRNEGQREMDRDFTMSAAQTVLAELPAAKLVGVNPLV